MSRNLDNNDRNFSADAFGDQEARELRSLFRESEVAEMFDDVARVRIGELIVRSMSYKQR